ncbi:MAG: hypothetical protein PHY08_08530 [Candidatus Cloacimonetes bacterium]|nr:hypothetical protein [Candidatus Cloacimonadota bacterium]
MKNRNILIILIISLAFNLGFIMMFLYHSYFDPKPFMPPPPPKKDKIHSIMNSKEMKDFKKQNYKYRIEYFKELAKPDYDIKTIDNIIHYLSNSQKQIEDMVIYNFLELRKQMTDEEAADFFGRFHERYNNRREKYQNNDKHNDFRKTKRSPK